MRSATPKLLHQVCGRPIIGWSVAAAWAAGAGKVVVVESPDRPLEATLTGQVTVAVQEEPRGTADAVKAAAGQIDPNDTVIVLNGDHPLITRRRSPGSSRRTGGGRGGDSRDRGAGGSKRLRTRHSGAGRDGREGGRDKGARRRHEAELQIREISTGIYAFEGGPLRAALDEVRTDNAQGEYYLPDVLPIMRARGRSVGAFELADPSESSGQRPRPAGGGGADGSAPDQRAPHAGRSDDRQPGRDGDRHRRHARRGRRDRAVHKPARCHERRFGLDDRPAHDADRLTRRRSGRRCSTRT